MAHNPPTCVTCKHLRITANADYLCDHPIALRERFDPVNGKTRKDRVVENANVCRSKFGTGGDQEVCGPEGKWWDSGGPSVQTNNWTMMSEAEFLGRLPRRPWWKLW